MKVNGRTTVAKFKSMFKSEFGVSVRVYKGNHFADESDTLASIKTVKDPTNGDFEIHGNSKVGNVEKLFKDTFGIQIQIEDKTGNLADNNVTIASLK
jgi:hypothetical protein